MNDLTFGQRLQKAGIILILLFMVIITMTRFLDMSNFNLPLSPQGFVIAGFMLATMGIILMFIGGLYIEEVQQEDEKQKIFWDTSLNSKKFIYELMAVVTIIILLYSFFQNIKILEFLIAAWLISILVRYWLNNRN